MSSKCISIYTDGAYKNNKINWAFIVVKNEEGIFLKTGTDNAFDNNYNVEKAESTAILNAVEYALANAGNYRLFTDSQSVLDKINNKVPNATKNPNIKRIQRVIEEIKNNPNPVSLTLEYLRRRSNEWSKAADDYCS